ncbi:MAG: hypothetical protein EOO44_22770 [Flavobacterium sp.]|nr:MAG: hypothetical protein EOO44_22770 [Flavobacterium sp.]
MKKIALVLCIFSLLLSCKTNQNIKGKYKTVSSDSLVYHFDTNTGKYFSEYNGQTKNKGTFKTTDLSFRKTLIICNEFIIKRTSDLIKEQNKDCDSITTGVSDGYKILGTTIFEITFSVDGNLKFRKTHSEQLHLTESQGTFIPQN